MGLTFSFFLVAFSHAEVEKFQVANCGIEAGKAVQVTVADYILANPAVFGGPDEKIPSALKASAERMPNMGAVLVEYVGSKLNVVSLNLCNKNSNEELTTTFPQPQIDLSKLGVILSALYVGDEAKTFNLKGAYLNSDEYFSLESSKLEVSLVSVNDHTRRYKFKIKLIAGVETQNDEGPEPVYIAESELSGTFYAESKYSFFPR